MATALLVIDVQVGVMRGAFDANGVIARISGLVDRARAEGAPVVWVQHNDDELVRDSDDWQIVPQLQPRDDEPRIFKTYSDSFSGTELDQVMGELDVDRIVMVGAQSDFCIRNTWHSALVRGFHTVLVSDAHTTVDNDFDPALTASTIIAYTNMYASWGSNYPAGSGSTATADEVTLTP